MKHLALVLALLLLGCGSAPPPAPEAPAEPEPPTVVELIEYMRGATVAIVRPEGDIMCSGVWIGPTEILTAAHCVAPEGATMVAAYSDYDVHGDGNQLKHGEPAYVVRKDDVQDLALLAVMSAPAPHAIATLSPSVPQPADMVHIVGHTLGIPYAYAPGFVDGVRQMFAPEIGIAGEFVQVWGGAYGGNSGGGLWDLEGRLLGVTSFRAGPLHWFVSGNAIRSFLNG